MNVGQLKAFIEKLNDDMEIVIDGEYNRGVPVCELKVDKRVWDDNYYSRDEKRTPEKCLIITIDEYLAESEDIGDKELFLTTSEYNDIYNQNVNEIDDEDELQEYDEDNQDE